jgi:hypothetical protein
LTQAIEEVKNAEKVWRDVLQQEKTYQRSHDTFKTELQRTEEDIKRCHRELERVQDQIQLISESSERKK